MSQRHNLTIRPSRQLLPERVYIGRESHHVHAYVTPLLQMRPSDLRVDCHCRRDSHTWRCVSESGCRPRRRSSTYVRRFSVRRCNGRLQSMVAFGPLGMTRLLALSRRNPKLQPYACNYRCHICALRNATRGGVRFCGATARSFVAVVCKWWCSGNSSGRIRVYTTYISARPHASVVGKSLIIQKQSGFR